ncbi:MAG: putative membrane protein [Neolewinella sp.]|jgi:putative membrane protein
MYIRRNLRWSIILKFAWKNLLAFFIWAVVIVFLNRHLATLDLTLAIPFLPLSTIGIAVAFYLGFKNNSAYDRFWEGRKIWGGIVNYSRSWAMHSVTFINKQDLSEEELFMQKKILIYRHIAWLNALRLQLRRPTYFSIQHKGATEDLYKGSAEQKHWDEEVGEFLSKEDYNYVIKKENTATHLIRQQAVDVQKLIDNKQITDLCHFQFIKILEEFYNLQGKCERIKNTPYPRQYAYFSKVFVWVFVLLLPFGLIGEFSKLGTSMMFLTIPFSMLISWIFTTMEIVGDTSEDPFENFINDVPMTALCRTIEIDLREMLEETDLPPKVMPEMDILM